MKASQYLNARVLSIVAVLSLFALAAGCGGSSSSQASTGGLTTAQVQSMINKSLAPVVATQGRVVTQQQTDVTNIAANTKVATAAQAVASLRLTISMPNAPVPVLNSTTKRVSFMSHSAWAAKLNAAKTSGVVFATNSASASCPMTLSGHPYTGSPVSSGDLGGISCTGYSGVISEASSTEYGNVQGLPAGFIIYYDQTGCTGNMYWGNGSTPQGQLQPSGSSIAAGGGVVFTADPTWPNGGLPVYSNPADYFYVPGGETVNSSVTFYSEFVIGRPCQDITGGITPQYGAFEVLPNAPSITGWLNQQYKGPVLAGSTI